MKRVTIRRFLVLTITTAAMLALASPAWAADFVVNRGGDVSDASPGDGQCDAFPQDPGSYCTLRAAVEEVNQRAFNTRPAPSDRITFDLPTNDSNIVLNQGELRLGGTNNFIFAVNVEIDGPGADKLRIAGPGSESRVMTVYPQVNATIEGVTITNGRLFGASAGETGAGIYNGGTLTLKDSVVTNNSGPGTGGGIHNASTLTVVRTTIFDNSGSEGGGGIFNSRGALTVRDSTVSTNRSRTGGGIDAYGDSNGAGTVTVENSTISGNSGSTSGGGGILNESSNVVVKNSTITNNLAPNGQGAGVATRKNGVSPAPNTEISSSVVSANKDNFTGGAGTDVDNLSGGSFTSGGYNLIGTGSATGSFNQTGDQTGVSDPQLSALQNNGGPTLTHLPNANSPALEKGKDFTGLATDQRGASRPQDDPAVANAAGGDGSEVGSVEVETLPAPDLSIDDASATEGAAASFALELSRPTAKTVTVNYVTQDGTATAPDDFTANSGTTTIGAGETQTTITVPVAADTLDEPDETFSLNLSNAQNANLVDTSATGVIMDDDDPPSLSIDDATVNEGDPGTTNATFTASLSAPSGRQIDVGYATQDGTATATDDYASTSGTLSFSPGATERIVTVTVNADSLDEPDEDYFVDLSSATIVDGRGEGTITDDDYTPNANDDGSANDPITLDEDDPNGVITAVLNNDTGLEDGPITLEVTTPPVKGTTTVNTDNTIIYEPDGDADGDDTYEYKLTDSDGQSASATVYIRIVPQNDPPAIDLRPADPSTTDDSATFTEGGGAVLVDANGDLTVTDIDSDDIEGATIRIANLEDGDAERLTVSAVPGINQSYDEQTGLLTLNGTASKPDYQQTLRTMKYDNDSRNPDTTDRRIEFVVNDGPESSNTATSTVTIGATNDAPTLALQGADAVDEGQASTYGFSVSDPDSDGFTVKNGFPDCGTGGVLVSGSLNKTANGGSFDCRFPDGPTSPTVRIQVTDAEGADSNVAQKDIQVSNVIPAISLSGPKAAKQGATSTYTFEITDPGEDTFSFVAGYPSCGADGKVSDGQINAASGSFKCKFTRAPARPTVAVKVEDSDGALSENATLEVKVASSDDGGDTACTINGSEGNDVLRGTNGRDVICGLGGNDEILGTGGDDLIKGGPGNDAIFGGAGRDTLLGGAGNDALVGGPGEDRMIGGPGKDKTRQ